MSIRGLMIHTCDIEQESLEPTTRTISKGKRYKTIKQGVACRVIPYPGHEVVASMRKTGMVISTGVFFVDNPEVDEGYRILWVDKSGKIHYLYVKRVQNPHNLDRYWKVDTEERTYAG